METPPVRPKTARSGAPPIAGVATTAGHDPAAAAAPGLATIDRAAVESALAAFAGHLDGLVDEDLAAVCRQQADAVADLEALLGVRRPRAQLAARKLAERLWASDPEHGCGVFGGVFHRAFKDRSGVRREERIDPRWPGPGGNKDA